jgi:hypothetical protein
MCVFIWPFGRLAIRSCEHAALPQQAASAFAVASGFGFAGCMWLQLFAVARCFGFAVARCFGFAVAAACSFALATASCCFCVQPCSSALLLRHY